MFGTDKANIVKTIICNPIKEFYIVLKNVKICTVMKMILLPDGTNRLD